MRRKWPGWPQYRQLFVVTRHCLSSGVILARPSCMGSGSGRDWEAEAVRGDRRGEDEGGMATLPAFSLRCWRRRLSMRMAGMMSLSSLSGSLCDTSSSLMFSLRAWQNTPWSASSFQPLLAARQRNSMANSAMKRGPWLRENSLFGPPCREQCGQKSSSSHQCNWSIWTRSDLVSPTPPYPSCVQSPGGSQSGKLL